MLRARRVAILAWLVPAACIAPQIWHQSRLALGYRYVDLQVYRDAGVNLLHGHSIYDYLTPPPQNLPFIYPPIAAVLAVPFALLPRAFVDLFWVALNYALLIVVARFAFRPLLDRVGAARGAVLLPLLVAAVSYVQPVRLVVHFGQIGLVLVALCVADLLVPDDRLRWPRGVLIGLATGLKLTPGVFIPYLWLTGRRRAAYVAAGTFVATAAIAFAVTPGTSWDYWTDVLFDGSRIPDNTVIANQSLRAALLRSVFTGPTRAVILMILLVVLSVLAYRRAARASRGGYELAAVAIIGLLSVVVSPVSWIHHMVWVVVAIGALLGTGQQWRRVLAAAAVTLFFAFQIPGRVNDSLFTHVTRDRLSYRLEGSQQWMPITQSVSGTFPDDTRYRTRLADGSYRQEPGQIGKYLEHCITTADPICSIPRHDETRIWPIRLVESSDLIVALGVMLLLPVTPVPASRRS